MVEMNNLKELTLGTFRDKPLIWKILKTENDKALILCKNCLDCMQYHTEDIPIAWGDSSIRYWLNNVFYNSAFSEQERLRILPVKLENKDYYYTSCISGGRDTEDRVFLLSLDEVKEYLPQPEDRIAKPLTKDGSPLWWLRTVGMNSDFALYVHDEGEIYAGGEYVDYDYSSVRPALWIKL